MEILSKILDGVLSIASGGVVDSALKLAFLVLASILGVGGVVAWNSWKKKIRKKIAKMKQDKDERQDVDDNREIDRQDHSDDSDLTDRIRKMRDKK